MGSENLSLPRVSVPGPSSPQRVAIPTTLSWSRFSHQNPVCTSPVPVRASWPARLILLDLITRTIFGEQYRSLTSALLWFSVLPCYLVPLRPKYSPQHPVLNTLSLRSSLNVSNQVSHPYTTSGKIIVLYIFSLYFWIEKWKTKYSPSNRNILTIVNVYNSLLFVCLWVIQRCYK